MQVQSGVEQSFIVTSLSGRCVASFAEHHVCQEWLEQRKDNGVTYRVFYRSTTTTEVPTELPIELT